MLAMLESQVAKCSNQVAAPAYPFPIFFFLVHRWSAWETKLKEQISHDR